MSIYKIKAFTLVELLIVIAIIGILSAVAIPGYRSYINRAEVTAALAPLPKIKTKVVEYYNESGSFPSSASDIGYSSDDVDSGILDSLSITNGAIAFVFQESGKSSFDLTITYTPSESGNMISWVCSASGAVQFAPSTCESTVSDVSDDAGGSDANSNPGNNEPSKPKPNSGGRGGR